MATARADLVPTAAVPLAAVVIVPATVMIMVVPATVVIVIVAATVIIMIVAAAVVMVIAVVVVARVGLQVAVSWQEFRLIMEKDHELAVRRFREIHVLLGRRPLVVHQRRRRRRHVGGRNARWENIKMQTIELLVSGVGAGIAVRGPSRHRVAPCRAPWLDDQRAKQTVNVGSVLTTVEVPAIVKRENAFMLTRPGVDLDVLMWPSLPMGSSKPTCSREAC
jgi:hypothetical protein